MLDLVEALEDLDDVQDVYSNFDISDAEMERLVVGRLLSGERSPVHTSRTERQPMQSLA